MKPGGQIGIAGAGMVQELEGPVPAHLREWWTADLWSLHSAMWWQRHWSKTSLLDVTAADTMVEGWRLWIDWHKAIAPDNLVEIQALETDRGNYLGYNRVVGKRTTYAIEEPVKSIPMNYSGYPHLRRPKSLET